MFYPQTRLFLFFVALIIWLVSPALVLAAPDVTSITPDEGPEAGGTAVTIGGTGFEADLEATSILYAGMDNEAEAVATDSDGNVYITGNFSDSMTIQGTTVNSVGSYDVYVAKFDSTGTLAWLKSGGGPSSDNGHGITVDSAGNVFVVGRFWEASTFGTLSYSGGAFADSFLLKLNSNGVEQWWQIDAEAGSEEAYDVVLDTDGNIYVTGGFNDNVTLAGTSVTTLGQKDLSLIKYDAAGDPVFVRTGGGESGDNFNRIALDSDENIYVAGYGSSNTLTFGAVNGSSDDTSFMAMLVKYNASGTPQWLKLADQQTVESGGTYGTGVAVDSSGNVYFGGSVTGETTFGGTTVGSTGIYSNFVIKYSTAGGEQWVSESTTTNDVYSNSLVIGADNRLYEVGYFFDDYTVQGQTISAVNGSFLTQYDSDGNLLVLRGGESSDYIGTNDVAVDDDGNVYVAGEFYADVTFDAITVAVTDIYSFFLTKFVPATPEVLIDGNACTSLAVVSNTELTCSTPAGTAGAVDVEVTNPDSTSDTLIGGFTYTGGAPDPSPTPTPTPSPTPTPTPTPTPNPSPVTAGAAHIGGPADNTVISTDKPTFSWTAPAEPQNVSSYQIIINGQSFFGDIPKETKETDDYILVYDAGNNTFLLQSKKIFEDGTYTWKITSKSITGHTTDTGERTFTIGDGSGDTTTVTGTDTQNDFDETKSDDDDTATTSGFLTNTNLDSSTSATGGTNTLATTDGDGGTVQGLFSQLNFPSFPVIAEATQTTLAPLEPIAPTAPLAITIAAPVIVAAAVALQMGSSAFSPGVFAKIFQALGLFNYGSPQGLVFDSATHAPIPFALLTIASQDKAIQETSVSDVNGVYKGVKLPPGTYTIQVGHQEFAFPSRKQRPGYLMPQDFYVGGPFTVKSAKAEQLFLIPMDNRGGGLKAVSIRTRIKHLALWALRNQTMITVFFFIFSALMTLLSPTVINIVITTLYAVFLAYKALKVFRRPLATGVVTDAGRKPIAKAIIKFVQPDVNQLAAVVMTNADGSYQAFVEPGTYQMMVIKPGYVWNEGGSPLSFTEQKLTKPKKLNVTLQSQQNVYDEMLKASPQVTPSLV